VLRSLNTVLRHKYNVPPDYTDRFQQADYTFRHQRVYDPLSQKLVTLTPLECDDPVLAAFPSLDFLGKYVWLHRVRFVLYLFLLLVSSSDSLLMAKCSP